MKLLKLPNTKRDTRRAKHMEKYVRIRQVFCGTGYCLVLKVGVQSFEINGEFDTPEEATWMGDMLAIALDKVVKNETSKA